MHAVVPKNQFAILREILAERRRQDQKFGKQHHAAERWFVILGEEVGEVAREVYEQNLHALREELIQCAAVCLAWLEDIDRE